MCTLVPAKAHQVQVGVDQGIDVDSNVLNSRVFTQTDGRYRLTPTISFEQSESALSYALRYRPTFSGYFDTDNINGWDHIVLGNGEYQLTARDVVRFDARFVQIRGIRTNSFVDLTGATQVFATQPGTTQRFDAGIEFEHGFSARTNGVVGLTYERWDFSVPDRVGNQGYGAEARITHAPIERLVLGGSVTARYRTFEETSLSPASYSTVLNPNLLARVQLTENLSVDVSGGPAAVFSRQSEPAPRIVSRWSPVLFDPVSCPIGPCARVWGPAPALPTTTNCSTSLGIPILDTCGTTNAPVTTVPGFPDQFVAVSLDPGQNVFGRSTDTFTYFVSLSLVYRLRSGALTFSFVRNEDAGSGLGSTTIVNSASASIVRALSDFWQLRIAGNYFMREAASRFPVTRVSARPSTETFGGNSLAEAGPIIASVSIRNFEQDVGTVDVSLQRQLTDHSRISFRFRYYTQSQVASTSTALADFDKFTGGIFYTYEFDPYKF